MPGVARAPEKERGGAGKIVNGTSSEFAGDSLNAPISVREFPSASSASLSPPTSFSLDDAARIGPAAVVAVVGLGRR